MQRHVILYMAIGLQGETLTPLCARKKSDAEAAGFPETSVMYCLSGQIGYCLTATVCGNGRYWDSKRKL